ncbi:MAG TPA: ABC transporter permease [Gemmatimonadaceae bacterium]|nr:ABC transporter permease [Gemmatimonadaceae bacterium]
MSLVRQIARGVRVLVNRRASDRELTDEVDHYLAQATVEHIARGLSPREAERAARIELGGTTGVREQVRTSGWEHTVDSALADVRYAARRLRATPAFTAITALTLALGIGATTAIWSTVSATLIRPLPYPGADRIVTLWDFATDGGRLDPTFGTHRELVARTRSFDALAVLKSWQPTATGPAEPERLSGQRVSAGYFRVFGVAPALGRDFSDADDRPNAPRVVILSDALWRRRFGADPAIIGRAIVLDDDPQLVIGIMPRGFASALAPSAELWAPMKYDMTEDRAWGHHLRMVGRLRAGRSVDDATRELAAIAKNPVAEFPRAPWASLPNGIAVSALQADLTSGIRPALLAILAAVSLVLVIVCVNVTNLLLARAAGRRGEMAVRTALGASRVRIVRQLLTESLLVALLGCLLGLVVADVAIGAIVRSSPPELPRLATIGIDGGAFMFALALTTAVGILFGIVPALHAVRREPSVDLQRASRRSVGGSQRTRGLLVVAEVALALLLLVSSGLLLRSIERLLAVPAGFDADHVLTMQVQTVGHRFDDMATANRFFADALAAVREVPGVVSAGLTSQLPLSGDFDMYGVHFVPEIATDPGETRGSFRYAVSPGYFESLRIAPRRGRLLDERDRPGATPAVVISESMAKRRLSGVDPIGQRLRIGGSEPYTVVGVVADVRQMSLAMSETDAAYTTVTQWEQPTNTMSLVVRARGDAASLTSAVRRAIWSVDKDQPIERVATMDELVASSAAGRRFALTLFELFALAALALAAAGIYGILAGSVAERSREIGVRAALGATRGDIVSLVLGQGMRLTVVGILIGVVAATVATRALTTMLFGISRLDPVTYAGVVVLLGVTAAVACAVPAWRAARVDPVTAIRSE